MKIEICEHLSASWLKHIKNCQIVQTNWTISPLKAEQLLPHNYEKAVSFIEEIKKNEDLCEFNIFKQSTISQFILQCEIDTIGVRFHNDTIEKLYMVDSAFHEAGLNYGDTVARILKKILRALIVADLCFTCIPCSILFLSPKCGYSLHEQLKPFMDIVTPIINKFYPNAKIQLLFNKDFAEKIYLPILEKAEKINDDNDLFLRSLKLCQIANKYVDNNPLSNHKKRSFYRFEDMVFSEKETVSDNVPKNFTYRNLDKKTPKGENQQIVFSILNNLIQHKKMTPQLVENLRNPNYCNRFFNLSSFPVLIPCLTFHLTNFELKRFYKNNPLIIDGTDYYVCSQWIPERIEKLKTWYEKQIN